MCWPNSWDWTRKQTATKSKKCSHHGASRANLRLSYFPTIGGICHPISSLARLKKTRSRKGSRAEPRHILALTEYEPPASPQQTRPNAYLSLCLCWIARCTQHCKRSRETQALKGKLGMSADRTNVTVAWIGVVGAVVTALSAITVAVVTNRQSPPNHIEEPGKPTQDTTDILNTDSSQPAVNITGTWRDGYGVQYDIVQVGDKYSFKAYVSDERVYPISSGDGIISGRKIFGKYHVIGQNPNLSSGTVDSEISPDGRQISGTLNDYEHGSSWGVMVRQ